MHEIRRIFARSAADRRGGRSVYVGDDAPSRQIENQFDERSRSPRVNELIYLPFVCRAIRVAIDLRSRGRESRIDLAPTMIRVTRSRATKSRLLFTSAVSFETGHRKVAPRLSFESASVSPKRTSVLVVSNLIDVREKSLSRRTVVFGAGQPG